MPSSPVQSSQPLPPQNAPLSPVAPLAVNKKKNRSAEAAIIISLAVIIVVGVILVIKYRKPADTPPAPGQSAQDGKEAKNTPQGNKDLNEWFKTIQLNNAKTLGPLYRQFLTAMAKHDGTRLFSWLTSDSKQAFINAVKNLDRSSVEDLLAKAKESLANADGTTAIRLRAVITYYENLLQNFDRVKAMPAAECFDWVLKNSPMVDWILEQVLDRKNVRVTGEDIKGDVGTIMALRGQGETTPRIFETFRKEGNQWRWKSDMHAILTPQQHPEQSLFPGIIP
jgi:hypothetical protein